MKVQPITLLIACFALFFVNNTYVNAFINPGKVYSINRHPQTTRSIFAIQTATDNKNNDTAIYETEETSPTNKWQPNDVYRDLWILEQAIAKSNAEWNLKQAERLETLDYIAKQRRALDTDSWVYFIKPSLFTLFATMFLKFCKDTVRITTVFDSILNAHFRLIVYGLPLSMLFIKHWKKKEPKELPADLAGLEQSYLKYATTLDWEDPAYSCKDYVLCLLEQWSSAVACAIIFIPNLPLFSRAQARIITRLGVVAALHQFPKQWFELVRQGQPRPQKLWVLALQRSTQLLLSSWMIAAEMALVLVREPISTIVIAYIVLVATYFSIRRCPPPPLKPFDKIKLPPAKYVIPLAMIWYVHEQRLAFRFIRRIAAIFGWKNLTWLVYRNNRENVWTSLTMLGACICPLTHLAAWRNIFRVQYAHDLSLVKDPETFKQILDDPVEREKRYKWRYSLNWREPVRIRALVRKAKHKLFYWTFLYGSIEEVLEKEHGAKLRKEVKASGLTILQRVESNPRIGPYKDRDMWKEAAMETMKRSHKIAYSSGKYNDPLGVMLYRTFDIGLGFNFDHTSKLPNDKEPSTRRLQARAAKSAIKRVQQLYNTTNLKQILDQIKDPTKRDQKAAKIQNTTQTEINHIADRLVALIPNDMSLYDGEALNIMINEEVLNTGRLEKSPVVIELMKKYGTHEEGNKTLKDHKNDPFEEEFLHQWLRQFRNNTISKKGENNDDDDDSKSSESDKRDWDFVFV